MEERVERREESLRFEYSNCNCIVVGSEDSEVSDNSEDSDNSDNSEVYDNSEVSDNYSQLAASSHLSTLHSSPSTLH
jgi:hypothetical protein